MKNKKSSRVSILDVARAAGISKTAATYALQNKPEVSRATRERVLGIAKKLGYAPDPRLVSWMTKVQGAKTKELQPIAWLNTHSDKNPWPTYKFLSPYLQGARERAQRLGYRLEEIWLHEPGLTMQRVSQIIYQRGIEAVIVTQFARHLRFNWEHLAGVSLEGVLLAPRLDRVMTDYLFNFMLALKMVRRFGYRRVGVCLEWNVDESSAHACRAAAYYFQATIPTAEQIEPLFYPWGKSPSNEEAAKRMVITWIRRHKPEVIVGHNNLLVELVEKAGYRVPEDIGVVHLATDDDVSDWAGIHSNRREIGGGAVQRVISLLQNRQFGMPQTAENVMIRGLWHPGRTLLIPKPK